MTKPRVRRRGEPLLVLGMIMLCWVGVRAMLWRSDTSRASVLRVAPAPLAETAPPAPVRDIVSRSRQAAAQKPFVGPHGEPLRRGSRLAATAMPPPNGAPPGFPSTPAPLAGAPVLDPAGGQMMFEPAAGGQASPGALPAGVESFVGPPAFAKPYPAVERRWSADAWALVRSGGGAPGVGSSIATYGGSQIGAVLRYRLMPGDPRRPTAYVRASAALNGSGEREAAFGLSARPAKALPIVLAVEGRVGQFSGRTVVRPAAMAITELAPMTLPFGARAEVYLQGGYVAGTNATPFVDGQLRADRSAARFGGAELRIGAGAWGGAQRGAGRLDVGPSVTLGIARGSAAARIGLDWRFRIEGDAEPASGPALTVSAGF